MPVAVVEPSTLNLSVNHLIVLVLKDNLSIICIGGKGAAKFKESLYEDKILARLSAFTCVSTTAEKSNIPTPTVFGVVLNVPTKFAVAVEGVELLIYTSAINLTLK